MENRPTSEICKKCAECCKNFPFVELTQAEIYALEKQTGLSSDVFTNPKGDTSDEYFLKFKENGDCFFLSKNNRDYFCVAYEARSGVCRSYPSNPNQNEVCLSCREMILHNHFD